MHEENSIQQIMVADCLYSQIFLFSDLSNYKKNKQKIIDNRKFLIFSDRIIKQIMEKQKQKIYKLKDLPPHLRMKYKNSDLFEENKTNNKKFVFDLQSLKKKKVQKQKTIQQKLQEFQLNSTQEKYLNNVFKSLSAQNNYEYFTSRDIENVLKKMSIKFTKKQISLMIWEIDQHLDAKINHKQFLNMYKKCISDHSGIEPKKIFHLTQFLMYCKNNKYTITVEDTLELLFVRVKKQAQTKKIDEKERLEEQIRVIFGEEQKTPDGLQRQVSFTEYLDKINKRAILKRKQQLYKIKNQ